MISMPGNTGTAKVIVGLINGVYGIHGEVKVFSYTRPREQIFTYQPWYLKTGDAWHPCQAVQGTSRGKGLVARIEGITDRDRAQAMMSTEIAIEGSQLPELPDNEYYWHQLIGLNVSTVSGRELGTIEDIEETGANDVLVLAGDKAKRIPYVWGTIVKSVDLDGGSMQVDWDPEYL